MSSVGPANRAALIDELVEFATARLRDIATSDSTTAAEKRTAREAERWHAAIRGDTNDFGYSQDQILRTLVKQARKWSDHPDYKDEWNDVLHR